MVGSLTVLLPTCATSVSVRYRRCSACAGKRLQTAVKQCGKQTRHLHAPVKTSTSSTPSPCAGPDVLRSEPLLIGIWAQGGRGRRES